MSYVTVKPGEPIPEAEFWPNVKSWERQKYIKFDASQGVWIALKEQKVKRSGSAPEVKKAAKPEAKPVTEEVSEEKPKKRGRPKRKKVELD
jgi:hypothetical protein